MQKVKAQQIQLFKWAEMVVGIYEQANPYALHSSFSNSLLVSHISE